jgi:hypothetical protein
MNADSAVEILFPSIGPTARPRAFGHGFEDPGPEYTVEEAYREYYKFNARKRGNKFTKRGVPEWLIE